MQQLGNGLVVFDPARIDTVYLPVLKSMELLDIISWAENFEMQTLRLSCQLTIPIRCFIEPVILKQCPDKLPDTLAEAKKVLFKAFGPTRAIAKLNILNSLIWKQPLGVTGTHSVSTSLARYNEHFAQVVMALALDSSVKFVIKTYISSLRGDIGNNLSNEAKLIKPSSLAEAMDMAKAQAF